MFAACSVGTPAKVIRIGVDLPLSGAAGRAGQTALNGVQFFVRRHPTIGAFTVQVVAQDDAVDGQDDPGQGTHNISVFAADPLVMGVIGPFNASVARREIPVANDAQLAIISPAVSSRCLTKEPFLPAGLSRTHVAISCKAVGLPTPVELRPNGTNNFFRLVTTDDLQGPAAADYGYKNLLLRRVAVLSDHEAYGQALASGFMTRFINLGGSVIDILDFDPNSHLDLTAFMRHAKGDGAQAIYYGGVTANHGCVIRAQMASVFSSGEAAPFLGGDGIAQDPNCVRNAGANAVGIYATVAAPAPDIIPNAQPVIAAFKEQYPNASDYSEYTIPAYDSAAILYGAVDRAMAAAGGKVPARDAVVAQVAATSGFAGASGTFGFDEAGDTTLRVVSVFESRTTDPAVPWSFVRAEDYSAALPY
ncbi:MAG TPA: branched-chain amino acid ABC transporter substrate-binding protein [Candidatus Dormibacteraeota bacterium]